MIIIADDREKQAYESAKYRVERGRLPIGDFSIKGLENKIAVERKTFCDLTACLGQKREKKRFEGELFRSQALDYFAIVVEASFDDLVTTGNGNRAHRVQSLLSLTVRYKTPIFFAGDRERGRWLTINLLENYWVQMMETVDLIKSAVEMPRQGRLWEAKQ